MFRALVEDHRRTAASCADILDALDRGRRCLVLSQWTEHLEPGRGLRLPAARHPVPGLPLAFKGRLVQYVGRILRAMDGKQSVEVHDYLDAGVPVLASVHTKRLPAFAALGFDTPRSRRRRA